jgi:hypothetical protein
MAFADLIKGMSPEKVAFTKHVELRLSQRKLDGEMILDILFKLENLLYEEFQKDTSTYKLIYSYSGRYKIVIAVGLDSKGLKVVTAYKTSKKLEKLIKSRGMVQVYRKPTANST